MKEKMDKGLSVMAKCKLNLIVLGTGPATVKFINECIRDDRINLLGNIPDYSLPEEVLEEYDKKTNSCVKFRFDKKYLKKADMIFSIEYRRIVPEQYVENYLFINCHGGILPKWRGFACNAWAIINGEKEIGYSIHRMNKRLDDGKLYYVKKIPINNEQTYSDIHDEMINSIIYDVPNILLDIFCKKNIGKEQKGVFCYCNRFSPSFGEINNFDKLTKELVNLYRCMAKPLGTGVYFIYHSTRFNIGKIEDATEYGLGHYIGLPGKIIYINDNNLWVKTRDTGIVLSDIRINDKSICVSEYFKIGYLLGCH